METKSNIRKFGNSLYLLIPMPVSEWLALKDGDDMVIEDKEKTKGKFFAAWKEEKKK